MAIFVLVHGAWHGGWCWERLAPLLEARGHAVHAPDLLGMGADATPLGALSLAAWTEQIAALIAGLAEPVILVGHSRGGIVISEVAERLPERVRRLVYLTAFLVPAGQTLGELSGAIIHGSALEAAIAVRDEASFDLAADKAGALLFNQCTAADAAWAVGQLCPEPFFSMTTPLATTPDRFGSVPRAYIECTGDAALPWAAQQAMQAALPCAPVLRLPADHSPFLSLPDRLAEALDEIARL